MVKNVLYWTAVLVEVLITVSYNMFSVASGAVLGGSPSSVLPLVPPALLSTPLPSSAIRKADV